MRGSTPNEAFANEGAQRVPVRNSNSVTWAKKPGRGEIREITIAIVIATETAAAEKSRPIIIFSPYRGLVARSGF
jgi:hypothetical protein